MSLRLRCLTVDKVPKLLDLICDEEIEVLLDHLDLHIELVGALLDLTLQELKLLLTSVILLLNVPLRQLVDLLDFLLQLLLVSPCPVVKH